MSFEYEMEPDPDFRCPNCEGHEFVEGPRAGLAINFICVTCRSWFNDQWPFGIEAYGAASPGEMLRFKQPYIPRKPAPR